MLANLALHLNRLSSRRVIQSEHIGTARVEKTLGFFVANLPALVSAERCNIYIYDPVAAKAWIEIGTGTSAGTVAMPTRSTVVGAVIASGRSRIVNDAESLQWVGRRAGDQPLPPVHNAAYAPVRSRHHDEVIGVIEVQNKIGASGFDGADLRGLEEAAEIVQDVVDSVFLSQKVFGATDAILVGGRQAMLAAAGLIALGSVVTLLLVTAWSALPIIGDALGPILPAL